MGRNKVMELDEFKRFVSEPGWERSQKTVIVRRLLAERWQGKPVYARCAVGWGMKINRLGGVEIIYVEDWAWTETDPGSFVADPLSWFVDGVDVVGEGGREVGILDLISVLPKDFSAIDYSSLFPSLNARSLC